jgi:hypothetical protein
MADDQAGRRAPTVDLLFVVAAALYVLAPTLREPPSAFGDAAEYLLMTESLFRHQSPDLRGGDVPSLLATASRSRIRPPFRPPLDAYVADSRGRRYGIHFWGYSLICLPAKALLRAFGHDELKAHQLTNGALFLAALVFLLRQGGAARGMAPLLLFSPVVPFVLWPHPETFVCSLAAISIGFAARHRFTAATLAAAFAAAQAPPLAILAFWHCGRACRLVPTRRLFVPLTALLPAALPMAFYLAHYGRLTLLPLKGAVDPALVSPPRALELLFDLDIGLFPYSPAVLAGALLVPWLAVFVRRPSGHLFVEWGVILATGLLCGVAVNWNHGTVGPSRYAVWLSPLVYKLFADLLPLREPRAFRAPVAVLALLALSTQILIAIFTSSFRPTMDHLRHSYLAALVMDHYPSLYRPSQEVFAERTLGRELAPERLEAPEPIVYRVKGRCRKALTQKRHAEALLRLCGEPKRRPDFSMLGPYNRRDRWIYVDY